MSATVDRILTALLRANPNLNIETLETFDPSAYISVLSDEEVKQLLFSIQEEDHRKKFNRFYDTFPDDGPLAWDKYPKHLEHFAAGKLYRERLFMAGNRCSGPWSFIETEAGSVLSVEAMSAPSTRALSWDGESQCVRPMHDGLLLGLEPAFRLVMDNGRFFDCSRKHRVLTTEGWLDLDQLMSRADGLRCWRKHEDYQASCAVDGHLGDQPLRSVAGIDLAPAPSQGGVQGRGRLIFSHMDAEVRIFQHTHAFLGPDRLSTPGDRRLLLGLCAPFAGPSSSTPVLSLKGYSRVLSQLALGLDLAEQPDAQSLLDQLSGAFREAERTCPAAACMPAPSVELIQGDRLSHEHTDLHSIGGLSLHDGRRTAIFFPCGHPELVGGGRIIACVPLGFQPIIDAHVEGTSNYLAAGMIHHNTGKSVSGAWELSAHCTGLYRPWWPGRIFRRGVRAWAAGATNETTRDIVQKELLGEVVFSGFRKQVDGSGLIPRGLIDMDSITWKQGVPNLVDTVTVKHSSGGVSQIGLKSYQQGRKAFEGTAKEIIWLDEEVPEDVYGECLIRLATTRGILILTFTPLQGLTEVVLKFMPKELRPGM